jgi:hypothetical protein
MNFLKTIGVVTNEDLQQFNEDNSKEDEDFNNEIRIHEITRDN